MGCLSRAERKAVYVKKLTRCLNEYTNCFIVNVDNVGSLQMQRIRSSLRGMAEMVLGKNTLIKMVIQRECERNENLSLLLPHIRENVGFVFSCSNLKEIRAKIDENCVAAPAKAGAVAPRDVFVPAQNTGIGPEKTSFFQALQIATKITKGAIEILNDVHLIHKDNKVGHSEAALLSMLKIYPFSYGLVIKQVYEKGCAYNPEVLDITPEMIIEKFMEGVKNLTCMSLALNYTTIASVPHLLANGFKNLLAISAMTDYTFEESRQIKEYLADPSKFAVAAEPVVAPASDGAKVAAASAEPVAEEESDDDYGFDLFG